MNENMLYIVIWSPGTQEGGGISLLTAACPLFLENRPAEVTEEFLATDCMTIR